MKSLDLPQRSQEWLTFRRTKIGASDCPRIFKSLSERNNLLKEKWLGKTQYVTSAMKDGATFEPAALALYNAKGVEFLPAVVQGEEPWMIASLDGVNKKKDTILEIKVVGHETWQKVMDRKLNISWLLQIQHQLGCVKSADKAMLWVCKLLGDELIGQEIVVLRSPLLLDFIKLGERRFYYDHLVQYKLTAKEDDHYFLPSFKYDDVSRECVRWGS